MQRWLLQFLETCSAQVWYCFTAKSINYTLFISIFICFLLFSCILNISVGEQRCRAHCITPYSLYICLLTGNTTDKDTGQKLAHKELFIQYELLPNSAAESNLQMLLTDKQWWLKKYWHCSFHSIIHEKNSKLGVTVHTVAPSRASSPLDSSPLN